MPESRPKIIAFLRKRLLILFRLSYGVRIFYIRCRLEFPYILNTRKLLGEGAEVGVWKGEFSEYILSKWKGKKLYSIDPWMSFTDNSYKDGMNIEQLEFDKIFSQVQELLKPYGLHSEMIRKTSLQAAALFNDNQLDFVYIDAQHHCEAVKDDIEAWFPKVKTGGILAGHDYLDGIIGNSEFGVKTAVDEFVKKNSLRVIIGDKDDYKSWFIFK